MALWNNPSVHGEDGLLLLLLKTKQKTDFRVRENVGRKNRNGLT